MSKDQTTVYLTFYHKPPTMFELKRFESAIQNLSIDTEYGVIRSDNIEVPVIKIIGFKTLVEKIGFNADLNEVIAKWKTNNDGGVHQLFDKLGAGFENSYQAFETMLGDDTIIDKNEAARNSALSKRERLRLSQAQSKLETQKTLDRMEGFRRFVEDWGVTAVMAALVGSFAIGTGYMLSSLMNANVEKRKDTINRVAEDPMNEDLQTKIIKDKEGEQQQAEADDGDVSLDQIHPNKNITSKRLES